jgi:hypothetical protein
METFSLVSGGRLDKSSSFENIGDLNDSIPVAVCIRLASISQTLSNSLRSFCVNIDVLLGNPSANIIPSARLKRTSVFISRSSWGSSDPSRHW